MEEIEDRVGMDGREREFAQLPEEETKLAEMGEASAQREVEHEDGQE